MKGRRRNVYKYLLFDIDQTLLDFNRDMAEAFERMYEAAGFHAVLPISPDVRERYNACNERWWRRFEQGLCTKPELYRGRFVDFFREAGLPPRDPDEIHTLYADFLGQTGTLFPGALELIRSLAQLYPIYIITNGNAATQKTRLQNSGLLPYIRGCFISETAGAAKPDKRYFDYVLSHIPGAAAKDCVVIGDSLTSDMCGARNAGMDSIWYNPGGIENTVGVPVTYEVKGYGEIRRLLLGV